MKKWIENGEKGKTRAIMGVTQKHGSGEESSGRTETFSCRIIEKNGDVIVIRRGQGTHRMSIYSFLGDGFGCEAAV